MGSGSVESCRTGRRFDCVRFDIFDLGKAGLSFARKERHSMGEVALECQRVRWRLSQFSQAVFFFFLMNTPSESLALFHSCEI